VRINTSDWPHLVSLGILLILLYAVSVQSPLANNALGQPLIFWSILLEVIVAVGAYLNARPLVVISDIERKALDLLRASPEATIPYQDFADELDVIAGKLTSEDLVKLLKQKKLIQINTTQGKRWVAPSRLRSKMV